MMIRKDGTRRLVRSNACLESYNLNMNSMRKLSLHTLTCIRAYAMHETGLHKICTYTCITLAHVLSPPTHRLGNDFPVFVSVGNHDVWGWYELVAVRACLCASECLFIAYISQYPVYASAQECRR